MRPMRGLALAVMSCLAPLMLQAFPEGNYHNAGGWRHAYPRSKNPPTRKRRGKTNRLKAQMKAKHRRLWAA